MIGGRAFARAGLDGVLDEVRLYNKELSADEVKSTMLHAENITDNNFIGYWDFESDANENNNLLSTGYNKELVAGVYEIVTLPEGNNEFAPQEISFTAGAPFISGVNYKIETIPTWKFKGGSMVSASGDGASGEAYVSYEKAGTFPATLTLSNDWGSDTKTIEVDVVKRYGIEEPSLSEMQAYPNPFENEVYLKFVESGDYSIELYDYSGRLINSTTLCVSSSEITCIPVNAQSGIYFIKVRGEGGLLKVMKVIKK
jgi:PKD repeat protein